MMHRLSIGLIGLAILLSPAAAFGQNECRADIRGTLMRKEAGDIDTKFVAKVDVSVRETCAVVEFDLIVVEEEPGGEKFEVRVPKRVKLRDSSDTSLKLNYRLKKGRQVASHRFVQTSCRICQAP